MSLGEWMIVSLILIQRQGFGWEYFLTMGFILIVVIVAKTFRGN